MEVFDALRGHENPNMRFQGPDQTATDIYSKLAGKAKEVVKQMFQSGLGGQQKRQSQTSQSPQSPSQSKSGRQRTVSEISTLPPLYFEWLDKNYLGGAHGLTGICTILLNLRQAFGELLGPQVISNDQLEIVFQCVDWCARNFGSQNEKNNQDTNPPSRPGGDNRLVQFCHGAPGFCLMYCKAHQVILKDLSEQGIFSRSNPERRSVYLKQMLYLGNVIRQFGFLRKGAGLCHGVAGNAYCFLAIYRALKRESSFNGEPDNPNFKSPSGKEIRSTKDVNKLNKPKFWLEQARVFAGRAVKIINNSLNNSSNTNSGESESESFSRKPDRPLSLFEGKAGFCWFLMDLREPDKKGGMPLFER